MLRIVLAATLALLLVACDDGDDGGDPTSSASPTSAPDLLETRFADVEPTGWHGAATMPTARAEVAAAVIDRKVYVVGGFTENGQNSDVVEVYDVDADSWSSIEPMPERVDHAMAAAANGKLYVMGGWRVFGEQASDAVHEYDPVTGEWTTKTSMPFPRAAGAAASDGSTFYVVGGVGQEREAVFVYDVTSDEWRAGARMAAPREHLAAAFAGGKVYAIGGRWSDRGNVATVEEYDPPTDSWRERASMPTPRGGLAAATVRLPQSGERVHAIGGESFGEGSRTFEENEVYNAIEDTWSEGEPMPISRHGLAAAAVGDELYAIAGGETPGLSVSGFAYRLVQLDPGGPAIFDVPPPTEGP